MSKLVTVKTRLSQSEHEQIQEQARKEDRSLASYLRQLIREKLAKEEA